MYRNLISAVALICAAVTVTAGGPVLSPRSATMARAHVAAPQTRYVSAYLTVDPLAFDRSTLESLGARVSTDLGDILTVRMPADAIADISALDGVLYVQTAAEVTPMLDVARPETGMQQVHTGHGLDMPYTGKGVVIGIVDSGFDYCHAAFRAPDGSLRIRRVWEQSATPSAETSSPEKFGYGVEFTDPSAILAAEGDIRNNSHGTHVTSIAAGSDPTLDGALTGMAPDADIVLVSMLTAGGGNVCISDAIQYIYDYADAVGKPCVVNLSLGNHSGPHDGTSTFDVIADRLQGPGRLIVGAAGNNRADRFHIRRAFGSADEAPLRTFVEYKDKAKGGEIEIWADKDADIEVTLVAYKISGGSDAERVTVYPSTGESPAEVSLGRNITGTFTVATEVSPLNGKHHILLTSAISSIRTGYAVALEVRPLSQGAVDIWADAINIGLSGRDIDGFTGPADESTICEIGGTAKRILTVGAYTTRSNYVLLGETEACRLVETDGDACSFSSCGPTADGRVKPQVSAPGCFISAAVSHNDMSGTAMYSHYHNDGGTDNYYGYMQGTSMAAPMVTGIVATWLEAYPEMTPEDLAEIARITVRVDAFTGDVSAGSNLWGYGKVDALAGIRECVARSGSGIADVAVDTDGFPARVIRGADGTVSLLFTRDCTGIMSVHDMRGAMLWQRSVDARASDTISFTLPTGIHILQIGHYTIKI